MTARAARGDIGGALSTYNTLWEVLDKEHDVEPSDQTQQLVARIKMAQPLSRVEASAPPMALVATVDARTPALLLPELREVSSSHSFSRSNGVEPKLIVSIGTFDVSGAREDQRYLVQGFRRELIACLVRFREWLVCDQASMPGDAPSTDGPVSEFVIEASAFQDKDGLRLVLMLKEAATKTYLWSERFQISMTRWLDAQQTIVRRLATALNVHLSVGRLAPHAPKPANDLKPMIFGSRDKPWSSASCRPIGTRRWRSFARRSRGRRPSLPRIRAWLNSTIQFIIRIRAFSAAPVACRRRWTMRARRRASTPSNSRGQLCLGWAYALSGNFELGAVHHSLAQELNDNDPWTLLSSGLGFAFGGDVGRGAKSSRGTEAMQLTLNPSAIHWRYQAIIRFMDNDYERLVSQLRTRPRYHLRTLSAGRLPRSSTSAVHEEAKKEVAILLSDRCRAMVRQRPR